MLIDLHNLCWKAYYTLGNLTNGVIFGTLSQITSLLQKFKDSFVVITADSPSSLRKEIYPEYKKNRSKSKKEESTIVFDQIEKLKKYILPKIGFLVYEEKGYEADDLIASIVKNHQAKVRLPLVISNDQDLFQLLSFCRIYNKNEIWYEKYFEKIYNITCDEWIKVKTIAGCSTDDIEGVKGVGEKTAIKYLRNELKPSSAKWQNINSFLDSEQAVLNKRLVKLPFEGCLDIIPERPHFEMKNLKAVLSEFNINKIPTFVWNILERS